MKPQGAKHLVANFVSQALQGVKVARLELNQPPRTQLKTSRRKEEIRANISNRDACKVLLLTLSSFLTLTVEVFLVK